MATTKTGKLPQLLVRRRLVTEAQLAEAMELQSSTHRFLGDLLVERGWISHAQLLEVLAEQYELPLARLRERVIAPEAVEAVPLKIAMHYRVMPLALRDSTLTVALASPQQLTLVDEVRAALQERYAIAVELATEEEIDQAIKKYYGVGAETVSELVKEQADTLRLDAAQVPLEDIGEAASDASVVKLVNQLMLEAHRRRATDIHIEPYRGRLRLRYRIDGVLRSVEVPPAIRQLFPAIISRVKVLSNLNIVERRLPQDGRASVKVGEQKLDLRVSILPTPSGESVVIRILPDRMLLELKDLGFRPEDHERLTQLIRQPHGLLFVTGPTGSGKTTTLYAMLKTINTDERKIVTIEDPVEYEMEGITQIQVHPAIGLTFAAGLRSMLRHDPNVMMVGEVRDVETAELAIRIALTGHLVFSTLHTNDAAGGVTRLLDMGVDPYLIVSSVRCFMAQRLIRVLCPHCKVQTTSTRPGLTTVFAARGCERCQGTGYYGRRAIYEILPIGEHVRPLILERASSDAIWRRAIEAGMRTMQQDGWEKVQQGLTTPEEVLRVTQEQEDEVLRITKGDK